jgi:hypothetical protein
MSVPSVHQFSSLSLDALQRRVPVVGDKALVDLVNGIQVSKDLVRYRKSQGSIGRLLDSLTGNNRQRQLLLDGNLIAGQEALHQWILELSDSLRISQVALELTQQSLLEARNAIRRRHQYLQQQEQELRLLNQNLEHLARSIDARVNQLDARIHRVEGRVDAIEDFGSIVRAWTAGRTYAELPWVVQVALLARELFSSSVAVYELETGDTHYRQWLVDEIQTASQQMPKTFFGLADLLDLTWVKMTEDDRQLAASLLEIRSMPLQRVRNTPFLFAIGTTLELAVLPNKARPSRPAHSALELCRVQVASIPRTTDAREFVTQIVEETANDCLAVISRSAN